MKSETSFEPLIVTKLLLYLLSTTHNLCHRCVNSKASFEPLVVTKLLLSLPSTTHNQGEILGDFRSETTS